MSKMAVIYTDLFLDPKTGIAKFNSVLAKLNGEFQAVKNELSQMQTRGQQLEDEINKLQTAPAGTPIEVRRRLAIEIDRIVKMPAIRDRLLSWGSEPLGGTPEDMDRMLEVDRARWGRVVQMAGIEKE